MGHSWGGIYEVAKYKLSLNQCRRRFTGLSGRFTDMVDLYGVAFGDLLFGRRVISH